MSTNFPLATSPNLHITHPTPTEQQKIWTANFSAWAGPLNLSQYLERETYLTTIPLTKNGGITHWILTDSTLQPDSRPILASCESLRKKGFVKRKEGALTEVVGHGIGSVFCPVEGRGRGYAGRMMELLGEELKRFDGEKGAFSVLWSDIGPKFYARYGWDVYKSEHVSFPPGDNLEVSKAKTLEDKDLQALCESDVQLLRASMDKKEEQKIAMAILPDWEHMLWHHLREDFLCNKLYGEISNVKGAIVGEPGRRTWAIWTRSFYGPVGVEKSGNTLHILRLVMEGEETEHEGDLTRRAEQLQNIIRVAQAEAKKWKLNCVELWNPSVYVQKLIDDMNIEHSKVKRDSESIASLKWFRDEKEQVEWIGNEKYGWC